MKIFLWLAVFFLIGCAPPSLDEYSNSEEKEIVSLLNERNYQKIVWLLEAKESTLQTQERFYLAQAHLGLAGFESLNLAAKISDTQVLHTEREAKILGNCPKERLKTFKKTSFSCLLRRIALHVPKADQENFRKARTLLRKNFPHASKTEFWINTLIGSVELASLISRLSDLAELESIPTTKVQYQLESFLAETLQCLDRARYSGESISRSLIGIQSEPWFQLTEKGLRFAQNSGLEDLLRLLEENPPSTNFNLVYGGFIEKLREKLDENKN